MATDQEVVKGGLMENGAGPDGDKPNAKPTKSAAPSVETVEVELGGVKVNIPKVFVDQYVTMETKVNALSSDIAALRKASAKAAAEEGGDDPLANFDVELFSNPRQAMEKAMELVEKRIRDQLQQSNAQTKARDEFWTEFYKQNKDLDRDTDGDVIAAVLSREYDTLKDLRVPEAIKHLATKSKAALLKIAQKRGGGEGEPSVDSEGANGGGSGRSKKDKSVSADKQTGSLSSLIRERRAARLSTTPAAKS